MIRVNLVPLHALDVALLHRVLPQVPRGAGRAELERDRALTPSLLFERAVGRVRSFEIGRRRDAFAVEVALEVRRDAAAAAAAGPRAALALSLALRDRTQRAGPRAAAASRAAISAALVPAAVQADRVRLLDELLEPLVLELRAVPYKANVGVELKGVSWS